MIAAWIVIILIIALGIAMVAWFIFLIWAIVKLIRMRMAGVKFIEDDHIAENGSFYNENGDWIG